MKHNFEERKQNRIEYALKQAQKNESLSEHFFVAASKMSSAIPFGQPIHVGHHSEKRDRNFRGKIDSNFRKSHQANEKADYYRQKAETIENNTAISSDDPQALQKLREQLLVRQARQEFMKSANRCIIKKDKEAFLKLPNATKEIWNALNTPDRFNGIGYPHYKLTNNNANIRRIKLRIAELEKVAGRVSQSIDFTGGKLYENQEAGRIQFIFDEKPSEETRKILKSNGFRWCRSQNAWQRHYNGNGMFAARWALKSILAADKEE